MVTKIAAQLYTGYCRSMSNRRAKAGGEVGRNGEHYAGGTFLPSTRLPKQGAASRRAAPRRALVMPGMIATIPDGTVAIFPRIREFVRFENGKAMAKHADDHPAVVYHFPDRAELRRLIALYNTGALYEPA